MNFDTQSRIGKAEKLIEKVDELGLIDANDYNERLDEILSLDSGGSGPKATDAENERAGRAQSGIREMIEELEEMLRQQDEVHARP